MAVPGDVLVELDVHQPVVFQRVHLPRLGLARLEEAQRLGDRHLIDEDLALLERRLRDAVAGLDDGRLGCMRGGGDAGRAGEEAADRDGVGGVVGALVDDLQHVVGAEDGGGDLHAAGAPAVRHRHLAAGERHLVAGDGDRLQDGAPDHALGLLVEVGEVVGRGRAHSAASRSPESAAARLSCHSRRSWRSRASSAWKST